MPRVAILLLVLAAGLSQPFQVAMHAKLNKTGGAPLAAAFVSLAGGAIVAAVLYAFGVGGRGSIGTLASQTPWWAWPAGALGVLIVTSGLIALPMSSAALVIAVMVFGQMLASLFVDHFGWLEVKPQPMNAWRIAGVVVVFAGVLMMQKR